VLGIRKPLTIYHVAVVTAPAAIDPANTEQLRMVLLSSSGGGHPIVVVDMTGTRVCDPAGFRVLLRAHRRALAEGGELRVVILPGSAVSRAFMSQDLDHLIPLFGSLDQALGPGPVPVIQLPHPRPPARHPLLRLPWARTTAKADHHGARRVISHRMRPKAHSPVS